MFHCCSFSDSWHILASSVGMVVSTVFKINFCSLFTVVTIKNFFRFLPCDRINQKCLCNNHLKILNVVLASESDLKHNFLNTNI